MYYVPFFTLIDPNDYISADVSVIFEPQPDGQSSPQCTDIMIMNDELLEGDETFMVEIQNPSQGVSPDPLASSATVIIADDDSMPLISFYVTSILLLYLWCSCDNWLTGDFV